MKNYIETLLEPTDLSYYKKIAGEYSHCTIYLTNAEKAVILKEYDYGFDALTEEEKCIRSSVTFNLKNQIHP